MITCVVHDVIDPRQTEASERFASRWIELVARHGGTHHGYFLPAEGASDVAWPCSAFRASRTTRTTVLCSGSTPTSSRQTASVTRAAAWSATTARSCGPHALTAASTGTTLSIPDQSITAPEALARTGHSTVPDGDPSGESEH